MRTRCCAVVIVAVGCLAAPAHADPRAEIAAKARSAMASYDGMDYTAARRQLYQALEIAKKSRLDKDPIVARVYLDLGITQLAGSDQEAAKVSFLSAVQIDPKITIEPGYKSAELVRMLDEARAAASDGGEPSSDDCKSVRGVQLSAIDGARRGVAQPVEALIGSDLSPARVVVMYRPEGAIDFTEARLTRQAGCRYAGAIPAAAMHGALVHYYVAAYDANNKVLAAK
ncbi:MAG TPA: tetratricopeptide repeat protein, partial [Kofleriaceae bacterium]